jgi:hypothetical protein
MNEQIYRENRLAGNYAGTSLFNLIQKIKKCPINLERGTVGLAINNVLDKMDLELAAFLEEYGNGCVMFQKDQAMEHARETFKYLHHIYN